MMFFERNLIRGILSVGNAVVRCVVEGNCKFIYVYLSWEIIFYDF